MSWARAGYGIDDLDGEPVVVRAEKRGSRVFTAVVDPRALSEDVRQGLRGRLNAVMSARESFTHLLDAPFSKGAKARKVLPTLLDIQIPFPLDECAYAFAEKRGSAEGAMRVLAVGARRADLQRKLDVLRAMDFDPNALDHEGLALWTQAAREMPAPDSPGAFRVVFRLGKERSTMAVGREGSYLGAHAFRSGDTEQVSRLLRAYLEQDGQPEELERKDVRECICGGPRAADAEVLQDIRKIFGAHGRYEIQTLSDPGAFLARALAVRALGIGPAVCNLRRGSLQHAASRRESALRLRISATLFLAAGLCLCAGALCAGARLRARIARAEDTFRKEAERLAGHSIAGAKGEHALRIVAARIEARKDQLQPFLDAFRPSLTGLILEAMTAGKRNGLKFDVLSVTPEKISIQGAAPSSRACEDIVQILGENGYAAVLRIEAPREDQWITFTIEN